jgi:hypothetical protein
MFEGSFFGARGVKKKKKNSYPSQSPPPPLDGGGAALPPPPPLSSSPFSFSAMLADLTEKATSSSFSSSSSSPASSSSTHVLDEQRLMRTLRSLQAHAGEVERRVASSKHLYGACLQRRRSAQLEVEDVLEAKRSLCHQLVRILAMTEVRLDDWDGGGGLRGRNGLEGVSFDRKVPAPSLILFFVAIV